MDRLASLPASAAWLRGRQVAVTGRLAAMSRDQAERLIAECGGGFHRAVTRRTSLLIVGLAGWPLRRDGRVSRNLQRAAVLQKRGQSLEILREDQWLERLGLRDRQESICRRHTLDQIGRLLGISADRVRTWMRIGLIEPADAPHGIPCFDFRQITALKRLDELTRAGVTTARLRRSLNEIAAWLPEAGESIARLHLLDHRHLVLRGEDGALTDSTGQRLFDFAEPEPEAPRLTVRYMERPAAADDLFAEAVSLEESGRPAEAETAYRQWLERFGPDPEVCFNLANALHAQAKREGAIERYRQALEIDPDLVSAWTNLGSVLAETGRHEEAVDAFRRALELDSENVNALYNLADALSDLGRVREARPLWEAYLRRETVGPWADYARKCLRRRS